MSLRKYLRNNNSNFITKELSNHSKVNHAKKVKSLFKCNSVDSKTNYKKQKNICVPLLRKAKRKLYEDPSITDVTDNKEFWKIVQPLLGNKIKEKPIIVPDEDNDLVTDEKSFAETFNHYFVNVVSNLGANINDDNSVKSDISQA